MALAETSAMTVAIIPVVHQAPHDVAEMVRPFLSPGGTVVANEGASTIIVRDYPNVIAQLQDMVARLDVPSPQVRVRVQIGALDTSRTAGAGITVNGPINGPLVTVFAANNQSTLRARSQMDLVIQSGSVGEIRLVDRSPHVAYFANYAVGYGYVAPGVYFTQVGTGVQIRPRVAGTDVVLKLVPFISYQSAAGDGTIAFREAETEIRVPNGNTASVTVGSSTSNELLRFIFGSVSTTSTSDVTMQVTPEILPDI